MDWLSTLQAPVVQQLAILVILGTGLVLFIKNRIRYDVVALLLIVAVIMTGVLSVEEAFSNFGHPALIIVASMFVMSEAFVRSGIVDAIVTRFSFLHNHPITALGILVILVTLLSSFINNAGALAIAIPIAIHLAHKSNTPITLFLLPLAFASHLGGLMTLIGTPRNILISDFRVHATGNPYAMFDFLPVGGILAFLGVIFLILLSWRLIPRRNGPGDVVEEIRLFTTEVTISPLSKVAEMTIAGFKKNTKESIQVHGVYRDGTYIQPTDTLGLMIGDKLIIEGTIESLTYYTEHFDLSLTGKRALEQHISNNDNQITTEVIIPPYTKLVGQDWDSIPLRERFGTNFIGLARLDTTLISPLASTRIWPNDVLLLQGRQDSVNETIRTLRLLPLATPDITFGRINRVITTSLILAVAITIATFNVFPIAVVFLVTSLLLVLTNQISLRQAYESIDQTVLILLAGMITLGEALERSGAAASIAQSLLSFDNVLGPVILMIIILALTALLSDLMNAMAAVVTMAPIAILLAQSTGASVDPFLMAVAVGGSCAFLTPIGHESNAMVMQRGGYTFKDYFRVGLPLELLIVIGSIPLILYFWPLY